MSPLHLSRIRLRDNPTVATLAGLLLPPDHDERLSAGHRLLWSLFADGPQRKRDFLWRDDGGTNWRRRTFLTLSARPPEDRTNLFEIESKPFEPALTAGRRLRFRLRASPAVSTAQPEGQRGKRKDPVALALSRKSSAERAESRHEITQAVGREWIAKQGLRAGFRLPESASFLVDGDEWRSLPRAGSRPVTFSVLDFEGVLEVIDPNAFLEALALGFGKAKAFGCGLMLIRPV